MKLAKREPPTIKLTDSQIEERLTMVEGLIAIERDEKNRRALVVVFQKLLDEQVRRDLEKCANEKPRPLTTG